jgi:hypothetical protein
MIHSFGPNWVYIVNKGLWAYQSMYYLTLMATLESVGKNSLWLAMVCWTPWHTSGASRGSFVRRWFGAWQCSSERLDSLSLWLLTALWTEFLTSLKLELSKISAGSILGHGLWATQTKLHGRALSGAGVLGFACLFSQGAGVFDASR